MKTKIIVFLCVVFMCSVAMAEPESSSVVTVPETSTTAPEKATGWTESDKTELKDQIGLLRNALNGETEPVVDKKVVVADKALTLLEKLITQIAGTVEKMAPDVFRIMYRQQIAKAFGDLIVPWLILFVTILYVLLIRRMWQWKGEFKNNDGECVCHVIFTAVLPLILCLAMCIWGLNALSDSICYLYNPEYYAIRDLINILMGGGSL